MFLSNSLDMMKNLQEVGTVLKDWIGFRQVIFIEVYKVKRVIKYMTTPVGCWERSVVLVVVNTGGAACQLISSQPIRFKQSQIQWLDWLMGFGSDSDWFNRRIPVSDWLILHIKSRFYALNTKDFTDNLCKNVWIF